MKYIECLSKARGIMERESVCKEHVTLQLLSRYARSRLLDGTIDGYRITTSAGEIIAQHYGARLAQ